MAIKKAFQPIVDFLEENKDSRVKTILPAITEMCSAKSGGAGGGQNFIKDADGNVTHIYCYYHQKWEDVKVAEYGKKANSATGLNTMCKEGTSEWTKAQNAAKKANAELLTDVASGKVAPGDIPKMQEDIAAKRAVIVPRKDGHGTDEAPKSKAA